MAIWGQIWEAPRPTCGSCWSLESQGVSSWSEFNDLFFSSTSMLLLCMLKKNWRGALWIPGHRTQGSPPKATRPCAPRDLGPGGFGRSSSSFADLQSLGEPRSTGRSSGGFAKWGVVVSKTYPLKRFEWLCQKCVFFFLGGGRAGVFFDSVEELLQCWRLWAWTLKLKQLNHESSFDQQSRSLRRPRTLKTVLW